jgi:hypothetical protein
MWNGGNDYELDSIKTERTVVCAWFSITSWRCMGSGGRPTAPHFLDLGTRRGDRSTSRPSDLPSAKETQYVLDRMLGGTLQSVGLDAVAKIKISCTYWESNLYSPVFSLVTILTELPGSWLLLRGTENYELYSITDNRILCVCVCVPLPFI